MDCRDEDQKRMDENAIRLLANPSVIAMLHDADVTRKLINILAESLWREDEIISGRRREGWEEYRQADLEGAMIYESMAATHLAVITPVIAAQVIDVCIKDIEAIDKAHNDKLIGIPHSPDYSLGLRKAVAMLHKCKENYK